MFGLKTSLRLPPSEQSARTLWSISALMRANYTSQRCLSPRPIASWGPRTAGPGFAVALAMPRA
eukprot:9678168-Lingulodinium_polyedra.AAC.1